MQRPQLNIWTTAAPQIRLSHIVTKHVLYYSNIVYCLECENQGYQGQANYCRFIPRQGRQAFQISNLWAARQSGHRCCIQKLRMSFLHVIIPPSQSICCFPVLKGATWNASCPVPNIHETSHLICKICRMRSLEWRAHLTCPGRSRVIRIVVPWGLF